MPASTCAEPVRAAAGRRCGVTRAAASLTETFLPVPDYDLAATLTSGQAFRWQFLEGAWEGVVGGRWVRLSQQANGIRAQAMEPTPDWFWLEEYLQVRSDLEAVLRSFPDDAPMNAAVAACRGLRVLRQDPWECLASFILSSTKQIVQIRQIIALLCQRYGGPVPAPPERAPVFAFPPAARLATVSEAELRACKMGFRAPSLLQAARLAVGGQLRLDQLERLSLAEARAELRRCRGVGEKIANCVLLFASDFPQAFPVDVWVLKALRQLYFPRRAPSPKRLQHFVATHFGPYAGWAQQYLFHFMRVKLRQPSLPQTAPRSEEARA